MTDSELMGLALEEARKAAALGEVPVGAVVARNGAEMMVVYSMAPCLRRVSATSATVERFCPIAT